MTEQLPTHEIVNEPVPTIITNAERERIDQDITLGWTLAVSGFLLAFASFTILASVGGAVFGIGLGVFGAITLLLAMRKRKPTPKQYTADISTPPVAHTPPQTDSDVPA
jgi:hypothetical protein